LLEDILSQHDMAQPAIEPTASTVSPTLDRENFLTILRRL
ncbi:hypothetical protein RRG08_057554, partial [Elysia crispata]